MPDQDNFKIHYVQSNPDSSNSRFFEPRHVSLGFAQSNSVILPPIFRTLDVWIPRYFEPILAPIDEIYKKFTFDFSNPRKVLLGSFHLNGHTLGFCSQTQNLELPSITQKTVPKKVHPSAFHAIWGLFLTSIGQFYYYHSLFKVYIEKENIADR